MEIILEPNEEFIVSSVKQSKRRRIDSFKISNIKGTMLIADLIENTVPYLDKFTKDEVEE